MTMVFVKQRLASAGSAKYQDDTKFLILTFVMKAAKVPAVAWLQRYVRLMRPNDTPNLAESFHRKIGPLDTTLIGQERQQLIKQ